MCRRQHFIHNARSIINSYRSDRLSGMRQVDKSLSMQEDLKVPATYRLSRDRCNKRSITTLATTMADDPATSAMERVRGVWGGKGWR